MSYAKLYNPNRTPQTEKAEIKQVQNNAGGYVFQLDCWKRLERFLVLGSDSNTYYQQAKALTKENATCVMDCLAEDVKLGTSRTVETIVDFSVNGRAPRQDAIIFALALAVSCSDRRVRVEAMNAISKVCRIFDHLSKLMDLLHTNSFRGNGRGLRTALADWYLSKAPKTLATQVSKYQNRNGWTQRDMLRIARPKPETEEQQTIFNWIVKGWDAVPESAPEYLAPIYGMELAKTAKSGKEIVKLISEFGLQREHIPTQWLADPAVIEAMIPNMKVWALLRNLGNFTRAGVFGGGNSDTARYVIGELTNIEKIRSQRLHPFTILVGMKTYAQGRGEKGSNIWTPVTKIIDALDETFYESFKTVESTGKRYMLSIDASGSMGSTIMGSPVSCRQAAAAMAMVTLVSEKNVTTTYFSRGGFSPSTSHHGWYQCGIDYCDLSKRRRLDDIVNYTAALPWGGTDCALPMLFAIEKKLPIDVFVVYTDSETWAGQIHPMQALRQYRQQTGIDAKLVVAGMTSTGFTIADPEDAGSLDVVGFDTAAPAIIADFARE